MTADNCLEICWAWEVGSWKAPSVPCGMYEKCALIYTNRVLLFQTRRRIWTSPRRRRGAIWRSGKRTTSGSCAISPTGPSTGRAQPNSLRKTSTPISAPISSTPSEDWAKMTPYNPSTNTKISKRVRHRGVTIKRLVFSSNFAQNGNVHHTSKNGAKYAKHGGSALCKAHWLCNKTSLAPILLFKICFIVQLG